MAGAVAARQNRQIEGPARACAPRISSPSLAAAARLTRGRPADCALVPGQPPEFYEAASTLDRQARSGDPGHLHAPPRRPQYTTRSPPSTSGPSSTGPGGTATTSAGVATHHPRHTGACQAARQGTCSPGSRQHHETAERILNYEASVLRWTAAADGLSMALIDGGVVFLAFSRGAAPRLGRLQRRGPHLHDLRPPPTWRAACGPRSSRWAPTSADIDGPEDRVAIPSPARRPGRRVDGVADEEAARRPWAGGGRRGAGASISTSPRRPFTPKRSASGPITPVRAPAASAQEGLVRQAAAVTRPP